MNQNVPGMQIAMYPGPVDIDRGFDAFMPLLQDGGRDQAGTGFYSFEAFFQVGCPLGQRDTPEWIERCLRWGWLM